MAGGKDSDLSVAVNTLGNNEREVKLAWQAIAYSKIVP